MFVPTRKGRALKRRKTSVDSDDDVFVGDQTAEHDMVEEGESALIHRKL